MNRNELSVMAQNKVAELEALVDVKSGNKNPDYYKTLKEMKLWCIIRALLAMPGDDDVTLNDTIMKYFEECSAGIKRGPTPPPPPPPPPLELLDRYKDVKDIWNKIKKACDDAGLKIVGSNVVKA